MKTTSRALKKIGLFGQGPNIIGSTGGSGTRVFARIVHHGGMYIGTHLNPSDDAIDLGHYSDRWINIFLDRRGFPARLNARIRMRRDLSDVLKKHLASAGPASGPWGWKEPRSMFLLPFFHSQFRRLKFLHVVRDGRDMAISTNQNQLAKHGHMLQDPAEARWSQPLRSMALWNRINLRTAEYGKRRLRGQYLRIRFEDLCSQPVPVIERIFDFFDLDGDIEKIAQLEVKQPGTLGRWKQQDKEILNELHRIGGDALEEFGYWSRA